MSNIIKEKLKKNKDGAMSQISARYSLSVSSI